MKYNILGKSRIVWKIVRKVVGKEGPRDLLFFIHDIHIVIENEYCFMTKWCDRNYSEHKDLCYFAVVKKVINDNFFVILNEKRENVRNGNKDY